MARADPDPEEDDEAARELLQEMVGNMTTLPRNRLVLVNRASAEMLHGGSGQGALQRFYEAGPAEPDRRRSRTPPDERPRVAETNFGCEHFGLSSVPPM